MSPGLLIGLMSLTVFMLTHLIVNLDFPPVLWLRGKVVGGWREPTMRETYHESFPTGQLDEHALTNVPDLGMFTLNDGEINVWDSRSGRVPFFFGELMSCPWCVGAWVALAVTAGTVFTVGVPAPVLVWFTTWALGSLLASRGWV